MPTAITADDERLMRDQLRMRLLEPWPELDSVGEAKNDEEAVALVARRHPDLSFFGVRMPGTTGMEAARQIGGQSNIVFVTAYDQYAAEAFERGALEYVLKPTEPERLRATVARLKERLARPKNANAVNVCDSMTRMVSQLVQKMAAPKPAYLHWIQASIGQDLRMIPVEKILFFRSDKKYTCIQTERFETLIRKPVRNLAEELDPALFWQIHRPTLVNVNAIEGVTRDIRGRHLVLIKGKPDKLEVSRSFLHLFKQM